MTRPALIRTGGRLAGRRTAYSGYEQAKREWQERNPRATPEEYQAAMVRIAARLGL